MSKRLLITSDTIGSSDKELGRILMRSFLVSLAHEERAPAAVTFANEGVRLACEGSDALGELRMLDEAGGVTITACGTCVKRFGPTTSLAVGRRHAHPHRLSVLSRRHRGGGLAGVGVSGLGV